MSDLSLVQGIIKKTLETAGNKETAQTFIRAFFSEIKETKEIVGELMKEKKSQDIAMSVHKLAGACGYFGAKALHDELLLTEKIAKTGNLVDLQIQLTKITQMSDAVLETEKEIMEKLAK